MLFNSLEFIFFLPIVFCLYWFLFQKNLRVQNLVLLISSYVFYGWWDWRFLSLIFLSTVVDYFVGLKIDDSSDKKIKKSYLWMSVIFNLVLLGFFKYFNFFIDSWIDLFNAFGYKYQSIWTLKVILPVGISFYTFQTMSYSLDIYNDKLKPTKDFISFASFVSFFPQLVAGPIERASNLLPQILSIRLFKYEKGIQGLRLILYGMFKKVVIADSLAWRVNYCFENYLSLDGGTLILGLIYFSFQIYCDFSGYSDIAIGTAKLFGFDLKSNFKYPYFAVNIREFWNRWHISLSTWFRDYVYIPLGGSKKSKWLTFRNVYVTFFLSGLWHGDNFTFIVWGSAHAILYMLYSLKKNYTSLFFNNYSNKNFYDPIKTYIKIIITYFFTTVLWVFFRGDSLSQSFNYLNHIIYNVSFPSTNLGGFLLIIPFILFEWLIRKDEKLIYFLDNRFKQGYLNLSVIFYYVVLFLLLMKIISSDFDAKDFIYFQF